MSEDEKLEPWFDLFDGVVEFNPGDRECVVNVGANQTVTVEKLYGSLAADPVRVRLEYTDERADWVVEAGRPDAAAEDGVVWVERARWPCQEAP